MGNLHYEVEVNGNIAKRHIDQLKPRGQFDSSENQPNCSNTDVVEGRVLPERLSRGKPPKILNL